MDTRRLILFVIFSFSIMMLWDAWQQKNAPVIDPQVTVQTAPNANGVAAGSATGVTQTNVNDGSFKLATGQRVKVKTDLFEAEIDTIGGDLRRLVLNQHAASDTKNGHFVLMDDAFKPMFYVAQSGLMGADLPNHKSQFTSTASDYSLADGQDTQEVRLSWAENGVSVDKIYTFHRNSYVIDVRFQINNASATAITPSAYYQIVHDSESNQGSMMMPTFTGGAYFTEADKFKKIKFNEMAKADLSKTTKDGWVGLVQHYFASAWIPKTGVEREFYTKKLSDNIYAVGVVTPNASIAAGTTTEIGAQLFAGPQVEEVLTKAAPGLEYTVDYGWLTIIAKPLFWVLSKIHGLVNNWGVAIILLTILIKAVFFPLSAASYKSMAQMRELAPRLQSMKEKFGDDKQKMQQAMLEMYRTEKINPMGGCLPILVQIPVFIALYWVLLASVELRHAPFFGWIQDLSATDPWFILPILMGATMIIQTYLNPAPTDPLQAKIMKIMPVVFSVFFFFFPAGLVLYWLVNNILSIAQQWYVNKTIHAAALAKKGIKK
ncbi:membrane protein insertase YidC [Methylotenera versatilis]|uniref:membrane protein insertase YidC n=1 Tax=Methylotenera versatilis TaxID=1055487 RepID=UPI000648F9FA|nr:membrane protein insertase YidC [Methylotenera versatilis]